MNRFHGDDAFAKLSRHRFLPFLAVLVAFVLTMLMAGRVEPNIGDRFVIANSKSGSHRAQDIVFVAITEETLAAFPYRSPIDRRFLADLVQKIASASPKKIGIDILLDGPSEAPKDEYFRKVLDSVKVPVVLAWAGRYNGLTQAQADYLSKFTQDRLSGSIVLQRDANDGVLRHLPQLNDKNGNRVATFSEVLAGPEVPARSGLERMLFEPALETGSAFAKYPAHAASLLPANWFSGKYVLIGVDLPEADRHVTSLSSVHGLERGSLPGTEVHAHILSQLLSGRQLPTLTGFQAAVLTLLAAMLSALLFRLIVAPGRLFATLAFFGGIYALAYLMFLSRNIVLLPLFGPMVSAGLTALFLSLARWWSDRAENAFLQTAFSRYVSPGVVERLKKGELKLSLGGEKRKVTYLFTDLQGFTGLAQSLPPEEMGRLLNSYLDNICELVTSHGATIDKIIGDAVVCFFGAPSSDLHQAENATELALAIDVFCEEFRQKQNSERIPIGQTRIGVHTGEAIIGNFGGERFFDYTGIGDTVNTAARLEGANRYLNTRICVSEDVAKECTKTLFRPVGELVLKGRNTPVECFEPYSESTHSEVWMKHYLEAYGKLKFKSPGALALFEKAALARPDDGPTRFHLDRLRNGETGAEVVLEGK